MSDEEIMQKLKTYAEIDCCRCWQKGENCDGDECEKVIAEKILNIYNRQQAEIERLKGWEDLLKAEKHSLIKSEAIKEFAERLRLQVIKTRFDAMYGAVIEISNDTITELVKEMVGGKNA